MSILRHRLDIGIFTLDTGRLHADTLNVIDAVRRRYGYDIQVFRPDPAAVAEYVASFGRDAFYESQDLRKRCCHIRKVEPLERALAGKEAWITGQRREQSATRSELKIREFDAARGMVKFNPLADWSEAEVWDLSASIRRSLQRAPRPGLPLDRLRALHATDGRRRGRARRALVVGVGRVARMRAARRPRRAPGTRRPETADTA